MLRLVIMGVVPLSAVIQLALAGSALWVRLAVPGVSTGAALATWLLGPRRAPDVAAEPCETPGVRVCGQWARRLIRGA